MPFPLILLIKRFFVVEKAIASFELINETLIITSIGNIPYNKGVEIELNGKTFVKIVELGLEYLMALLIKLFMTSVSRLKSPRTESTGPWSSISICTPLPSARI